MSLGTDSGHLNNIPKATPFNFIENTLCGCARVTAISKMAKLGDALDSVV